MTRGPGPPCQRLGHLFLAAEMKRHTTAGGGSLFGRARRFALSAPRNRHPRSMTRGPGPPCQRLGHCFLRRRRGVLPRAAVRSSWRFAFSALGGPHTICMTCGPGPLCHRLGCFSVCRARFPAASRGASGSAFLEKGFAPRAVVTFSHSFQLLHPFAFEFSAPRCICAPMLSAAVVVVALLVHPERF
jgi:hypothetical protein